MLYHLIEVRRWEAAVARSSPYYPPTYAKDGFTHLTQNANMLLGVANHFYRDVKGDWLCLELDPAKINDEVKFEPAAPVGEKASSSEMKGELFPHLYGPVHASSVKQQYTVRRSAAGEYLEIEGLDIQTKAPGKCPFPFVLLHDPVGGLKEHPFKVIISAILIVLYFTVYSATPIFEEK